jgi:hypothetical protein
MDWREFHLVQFTDEQIAIIVITLIASVACAVLKALVHSTKINRAHFLVGTELCLSAVVFVLVTMVEKTNIHASHVGQISTSWPNAMLATNILILLLVLHHDSQCVQSAATLQTSVSYGRLACSWVFGVVTLCVSMYSIIRFAAGC